MCDTCGCIPLARSKIYQFTSPLFSYPAKAHVETIQEQLPDTERWLSLLEDQPSLEAVRALREIIASYSWEQVETDYIQTFGHTISKECPPYEAEYGQSHIFQKSHALADVVGFYNAFGLELDSGFKDRPDHISLELEFMHFLCLKEVYGIGKGHDAGNLAVCRDAQTKFLDEHLGLWAFGFARRLHQKAAGTLYHATAQLLTAFLTFELHAMGREPEETGVPDLMNEPDLETTDCEACPVLSPAPG